MAVLDLPSREGLSSGRAGIMGRKIVCVTDLPILSIPLAKIQNEGLHNCTIQSDTTGMKSVADDLDVPFPVRYATLEGLPEEVGLFVVLDNRKT